MLKVMRMSTPEDWARLGESSAAFVRALESRWDERARTRAEHAARFLPGAAGWEGWDAAAEQSAIRDALLVELRRLDPTNPLLQGDVRRSIAERGLAAFIHGGREDLADAGVVSKSLMPPA